MNSDAKPEFASPLSQKLSFEKRSCYLDNAASTPIFPELLEQIPGILSRSFANPGSPYPLGFAMRRQLATAAQRVLHALGASPDNTSVIWTSGGTEANNLAILGTLARIKSASAKDEIVTTTTEHASVQNTCAQAARNGTVIRYVEVTKDGQLNSESVDRALSEQTILVSVCLVQNETGVMQNLVMLRRLMDQKAPRALLHVDAVQAVGRVDLNWDAARVDLMSVAGHKIHAPGGVGCLLVRQGCQPAPILFGGGQQNGIRSGSPDVAGIEIFSLAVEKIIAGKPLAVERTAAMRTELFAGLQKCFSGGGHLPSVRRISPPDASPFICSFSFPGRQGAILARMLGEQGIHVGTGSACAAEQSRPSRVLTAMGFSRDEAYGMLRVSFSHLTEDWQVSALLAALEMVLERY